MSTISKKAGDKDNFSTAGKSTIELMRIGAMQGEERSPLKKLSTMSKSESRLAPIKERSISHSN